MSYKCDINMSKYDFAHAAAGNMVKIGPQGMLYAMMP